MAYRERPRLPAATTYPFDHNHPLDKARLSVEDTTYRTLCQFVQCFQSFHRHCTRFNMAMILWNTRDGVWMKTALADLSDPS